VAAPITRGDDIAGVVSVGKPTRNAERFLERLLADIRVAALLVGAVALAVGLLLHGWLARPLRRLANYAHAVSCGDRVGLPRLGRNEVGRVGEALEQMRESLDGKTYVEDYVQALTHELKTPIAAIRGASELLEEDLLPTDRARFIGNIRAQTDRMQELVERLLDLASLERRPTLEVLDTLELRPLVESVIEELSPLTASAGVRIENRVPHDAVAMGERFLLAKALLNLIKNAVEFSSPGGAITVDAEGRDGRQVLSVADAGPGIPDYARDRVFERFYALPKPDGSKGSGLGLSFVREIAELLSASVELDSRPGSGTKVKLTLMGPSSQPGSRHSSGERQA
jgi:two-component system sensor histidine kinase CreC